MKQNLHPASPHELLQHKRVLFCEDLRCLSYRLSDFLCDLLDENLLRDDPQQRRILIDFCILAGHCLESALAAAEANSEDALEKFFATELSAKIELYVYQLRKADGEPPHLPYSKEHIPESLAEQAISSLQDRPEQKLPLLDYYWKLREWQEIYEPSFLGLPKEPQYTEACQYLNAVHAQLEADWMAHPQHHPKEIDF